jgi:hypothetical protein
MDVIGLGAGLDEGYAAAWKLYRSLGFVELPGSPYIGSSILPEHREQGIHLEVLTDWVKSPISTGRREVPTSP